MRVFSMLGDVFWSAMITLVLLIIAFFVLRVVSNVTRSTPLGGIVDRVQRAATPAGA